ncbi:MAG: GNAT family N-acetyltransferase [Candidatus Limnocylindrales bacterium]
MTEVRVRRLDEPSDAELAELAELFDAYRVHYGEQIDAGASGHWLAENLASGHVSAFLAAVADKPAGFALTIDIPASLRLGHYWQLRDLFVVPGHRRLGIARALLDAIRTGAAAEGALRLAVQTEDDNAAARLLYESSGFVPVGGYVALILPLASDDSG